VTCNPPGKGAERLPYSHIPWPSSLENMRSFLILFLFHLMLWWFWSPYCHSLEFHKVRAINYFKFDGIKNHSMWCSFKISYMLQRWLGRSARINLNEGVWIVLWYIFDISSKLELKDDLLFLFLHSSSMVFLWFYHFLR
jgi:hypothetical protein